MLSSVGDGKTSKQYKRLFRPKSTRHFKVETRRTLPMAVTVFDGKTAVYALQVKPLFGQRQVWREINIALRL